MKLPLDRTGALPGTWTPAPAGMPRERFKATVRCPDGHEMTLRAHVITDDGVVGPSLVCPERGCSFHEWVTLDGWAP